MMMGSSGLARSLIAIAISAMREAVGSIFPTVASLNVLLTIFATVGQIGPVVSSHLPDRDRDLEVLMKSFKFPFEIEGLCDLLWES